jgi:hypothetical protein
MHRCAVGHPDCPPSLWILTPIVLGPFHLPVTPNSIGANISPCAGAVMPNRTFLSKKCPRPPCAAEKGALGMSSGGKAIACRFSAPSRGLRLLPCGLSGQNWRYG